MTLQGNKTAATLVVLSAFVPNLLLTDDAMAQATAGDTMHVSAKVVNPLEVTPSVNFQLNFKSFAIKGTGSYLLMPGGTQSISNGVTVGGATAGTALIKVPQSVSFTLSIPTFQTKSIIMTNGGGGVPSKEMTVKSILFSGKSGIAGITGTLKNGVPLLAGIKVTNPADSGRFLVGARIFFDPNQVEGTYRGTFIVRITL